MAKQKKITDAEREEIEKLHLLGYSYGKIGRHIGRSSQAVMRVINGESTNKTDNRYWKCRECGNKYSGAQRLICRKCASRRESTKRNRDLAKLAWRKWVNARRTTGLPGIDTPETKRL